MSTRPTRLAGFALVTAMIFLLVLTLVAVSAVRGTSLELKMSANKAMRTEALEASEASRVMVSRLVDIHTFNRGWPARAGGGLTDDEFAYPWPAGLALERTGGAPRAWYLGNTESLFDPDSLLTDAIFRRDAQAGGQLAHRISSELAVYKMRVAINPGAGAAMNAGYEGTGKGAAASGGSVYYMIRSRGSDPGDQAVSVTSADTRSVIRN